ncbi:uncharacterized protein LOC130714449 [Lotus japonicus]|uniref:uncharacterized protein LOC130714449 n=1 Tax=Lotus japonicus TaxID=34305 RepID=UPI0025845A43|nr:uncharacterized protein LOC130714449 [Lotus japonicus]
MGNCIVPASSMEWDGEDWGNSLKSSSSKVFDEAHVLSLAKNVKKEKLLRTLKNSGDANGMVKIKISKKEVAELFGLIEKQQLNNKKKQVAGGASSAEQVLLRLINARNKDHENYHHRPWRPVLETVPELD